MFNPSRSSAVLLALAWSSLAFGQTVLHTDRGASSGAVSKNVVKDASGALYALSASAPLDPAQDLGSPAYGPLLLQKSLDSGATWTTVPFTFNDVNSGLIPPAGANPTFPPINYLTSRCSLAIDGQGRLHAFFSDAVGAYYRNYHPGTGVASPLCFMGAAGSVNGLVVDQASRVWIIVTSLSLGTYDEQLVVSNAPYAAGLLFTNLGSVSPNGGSVVSETSLVVDAAGSIHCVYQWNSQLCRHRRYVPNVGWDATATTISTPPSAPALALSNRLAADALGHVHCLFMQNHGPNSAWPTNTWQLRYRQWSPVSGWSPMTSVMDVAPAQYVNVAMSDQIYAIGCDESTGRVTAVYRSVATNGAIVVAEKSLLDVGFNTVGQLAPASTGFNEYLAPTIRGALYPSFNWTANELDVTWMHWPGMTVIWGQSIGPVFAPTNEIVFAHGTSSWCWVSLAAPPVIGTTISLPIDCPWDPSAAYALACSFGMSPGIGLLDGRVIPLNADPLLAYTLAPNPFLSNSTGVLSMAGSGVVGMSIPNAPTLIGMTFYTAFVTLNPTSPSGITFISPARAIQIQ